MQIQIDSKDVEDGIQDAIRCIKDGVIKGQGDLAINTAAYYRNKINENMLVYGRTGHTRDRESIARGAISITSVYDYKVSVIQSALAGVMMEVNKSVPGASIGGGKYIIPNTTVRGRKWLKEHGYIRDGKTHPIMIDGRSKLTGRSPMKPMEEAFNKYTKPMAAEVISKAIEKEVDEEFGIM